MDTRSFFCCLNEVEILFARLFGRSLEGLNATGTSDMQNYYEMIAAKQDAQLRPILEKLLPVIAMSVWGAVPDDLDFEFNSVRQPDDKELTDLAKNGSDSVIAVYNAGLVSQQTALRELKQQSVKTGIWTNITDEDIEKASDELEQPPEEGDMGGEEQPEETGGEDGKNFFQAEGTPQKVTDAKTDANGNDHSESDGRFVSKGDGGAKSTKKYLQSSKSNGNVNNKKFRYNYTLSQKTLLKDKGLFIPANSSVSKVYPFLKGKLIRELSRLCNVYKTDNNDKWCKVRCTVNVENEKGEVTPTEVHYYFHPSVGEVEYKLPTRLAKGGKL